MQLFLIIAVVILIVFGSVHLQNQDPKVALDFLTMHFEKPIALYLGVAFVFGFIISAILFVPPWLKKANLARQRRKQIEELEAGMAEESGPVEIEEPEREEQGDIIVEDYRKED